MSAAVPKACYISVGGNIHPEQAIPAALERLHQRHPIAGVSTFYRTAPINRPEQPPYLNGAVLIYCIEPPRTLKYNVLRPIEEASGRKRTEDAFAARPVDLDIVLCDDLVIEEPGLTLPDPDIWARPFLAASLLDLAPNLVVPGMGKPLALLVPDEQRTNLTPDEFFTQQLKERFL